MNTAEVITVNEPSKIREIPAYFECLEFPAGAIFCFPFDQEDRFLPAPCHRVFATVFTRCTKNEPPRVYRRVKHSEGEPYDEKDP